MPPVPSLPHAARRVTTVGLLGSSPRRLTSSITWAPVPCTWYDFSTPVPYMTSWRWQQGLLAHRTSGMGAARASLRDVVISLEHPHVYTLGRSATAAHLLFDPASGAVDAEVHTVERGGQVTYHGPGQLVVYPLLNLTRFSRDLHWYVRTLEDTIIGALAHFGLEGSRSQGFPGVWVGSRKIAAVGMACSKWVTSHGLALNVQPDLRYFQHIVPCGIEDRAVTSIAAELGHARVSVEEAKRVVLAELQARLNAELHRSMEDPVEEGARALAEAIAQERATG